MFVLRKPFQTKLKAMAVQKMWSATTLRRSYINYYIMYSVINTEDAYIVFFLRQFAYKRHL